MRRGGDGNVCAGEMCARIGQATAQRIQYQRGLTRFFFSGRLSGDIARTSSRYLWKRTSSAKKKVNFRKVKHYYAIADVLSDTTCHGRWKSSLLFPVFSLTRRALKMQTARDFSRRAFADYRVPDRFPRRRGFEFRGSGWQKSRRIMSLARPALARAPANSRPNSRRRLRCSLLFRPKDFLSE